MHEWRTLLMFRCGDNTIRSTLLVCSLSWCIGACGVTSNGAYCIVQNMPCGAFEIMQTEIKKLYIVVVISRQRMSQTKSIGTGDTDETIKAKPMRRLQCRMVRRRSQSIHSTPLYRRQSRSLYSARRAACPSRISPGTRMAK